jgi:hypothetical protein
MLADVIQEKSYCTSNIKRFDNNRQRFQELIWTLGTFTENEIIDRFIQSGSGDTAIDTNQTIEDYLQQMVYIGVLKFEFGRYTVR